MNRPFLALATFLISTSAAFAQCLNYSLDAPLLAPAFAAPKPPSARVAGDLNNDGRDDYVGVESGTLVIYLDRGDGRFDSRPTTIGAYELNYQIDPPIVIADFNKDGANDILFGVNPKLLIGDGSGDFSGMMSVPIRFYADSLTVGDFNADGVPDFAATSAQSDGEGVTDLYVGRGNGSFDFFETLKGPRQEIRAADMDGDGRDDIVGITTFAVHVAWTMPSLHATPTWRMTFPSQVWDVDAADLNGDGLRDLVIVETYTPELSNRSAAVSLLNDRNGGFAQGAVVPVPPTQITLRDVNGDRIIDLLADDIRLLGNGDGSFRDVRRIPAVRGDYAIAADFNGDGADDIVTSNYAGATATFDSAILWNTGGGSFRVQRLDLPGTVARPLTSADFDGDGRPEIVVGSDGHIVVLSVGFDGKVTERARLQGPDWYFDPSGVTVGRFRRGGPPEIAIATGDGFVRIFDVQSPAAPRLTVTLSPSVSYIVHAVDMNGDGVDDLVVTGRGLLSGFMHDFWPSRAGFVSVYLSDGSGFGTERRLLDTPNNDLKSLAVGDFDRDGNVDVLTSYVQYDPVPGVINNIGVAMYGDGTGAIARQSVLKLVFTAAAVGDVNGDGFQDVVADDGTILFGSRDGLQAGPRYYMPGRNPVLVRDGRGGTPNIALTVSDAPELIYLTARCGGRTRAVRR